MSSKPDPSKNRNSVFSGQSSVSKTTDKNKSSGEGSSIPNNAAGFKQFENSRQSGVGFNQSEATDDIKEINA